MIDRIIYAPIILYIFFIIRKGYKKIIIFLKIFLFSKNLKVIQNDLYFNESFFDKIDVGSQF